MLSIVREGPWNVCYILLILFSLKTESWHEKIPFACCSVQHYHIFSLILFYLWAFVRWFSPSWWYRTSARKVSKLLLKNILMKARLTICSPTNQQAKSISAVQTIAYRSSYLLPVSLTLAKTALGGLLWSFCRGNILLILETRKTLLCSGCTLETVWESFWMKFVATTDSIIKQMRKGS